MAELTDEEQASSADSSAPSLDSMAAAMATEGGVWSGDSVIKQITRDVLNNKDWWSQLADHVCRNISSRQPNHCWNGQLVGT